MTSLLTEIEEAISRGTPETRAKALSHATDVLVRGRYDEGQIWVFGEVISRLMDELEESARAALSKVLSTSTNAPKSVVRRLALDNSIRVAGPVLQHSNRVDRSALVEVVNSKGQDHLLAVTRRGSVDKALTDVLVRRGNREVVSTLVNNKGAELSEFGFLHLVRRTANDSIVAAALGLRQDIPRHVFQQLIAKASEEVRRKLASERIDLGSVIDDAVSDATARLHAKFGPASSDYFQAKRAVRALRDQGRLNEDQLLQLAQERRFYDTTVALATLCDVPPHIVERALSNDDRETILILAKARNFSWQTAMALLFLGAPEQRMTGQALDQLEAEYSFLSQETSQEVLHVYRTRKG